MNRLRGIVGMASMVGLLLPGAGCTRLLDHDAKQCRTSEDCQGTQFHNHPFCDPMEFVCVPSGLAPDKCFFASPLKVPTKPEDFLNQCSTSFLPSSRDNPLGECLSFTGVLDPGAMIMPPSTPLPPPAKTGPPATVLCKNLVPDERTVVYISGSSNFQPLLAKMSPVIAANTDLAPVFRITTSCTGVKSMNPMSPTYASDHVIKDPTVASDSYAQIFLGDAPPVNCLLGPSGAVVDIGESEIYPDTCGPPANDPETVSEGIGPILPIVFAVPQNSTERSISYTAARQVFGGGGGVMPWEEPLDMFVRGQGTATLRLVAKELDLMPTAVWGVDQGSAAVMANNLAGITNYDVAQKAIGIIGADYYDGFRGPLKALGYQAQGQSCAYVPDSSLTSMDKINVRDGHYPLWGRIHFFTARLNGIPFSDAAQRFVVLLTNPNLDADILNALIKANFVPPCAMKVKRATELGDLVVDDPTGVACGCAFDLSPYIKAGPRDECKACASNDECPANRPSCNYGYCEEIQQ